MSYRAKHIPATAVDPIYLYPQGGGAADGWLYNIQNLNTLWQDQKGTVATAAGQRIAMVRSLAHDVTTRGANLVTNGDFPTTTTGWTAGSATLSVVSAALRVTNSGAAAGRGFQSVTTEVGATYEIVVDLKTNANGAAIAVGVANNNAPMLLQTYAAGVTGNAQTFQFIARSTTSFVQLRTTSTTAGHFTEWDNVTVKKVAGWHMIQPDTTAQPILRQDAKGFYYLENDDGTRVIAGAITTGGAGGILVQTNGYLASVFGRVNSTTANVVAAGGDGGKYARFGTTTATRYLATIRDVAGSFAGNSLTGVMADGQIRVTDLLIGSAAFDFTNNRRAVTPVTATGFTGFQGGPVMFGLMSASGGTSQGFAQVGGWLYSTVDPGANRPGIRAWLANLMQAD